MEEVTKKEAKLLWDKEYGKDIHEAKDYSGRTIHKSGVNNPKHPNGWTVVYILPENRGGKNNASNLIISSIKTKNERKEKFPEFKANNKVFTTIKNDKETWEIIEKEDNKNKNLFNVDFFLKTIIDIKNQINEKNFSGYIIVKIRVNDFNNKTFLIPFIKQIFNTEHFNITKTNTWIYPNSNSSELILNIYNDNLDTKEKINNLLNKCILLNTYLSYYFKEKNIVESFSIFYNVLYFEHKKDSFLLDENFKKIFEETRKSKYENDTLYIGNLVHSNSDAKDNINFNKDNVFEKYNRIYTNIKEELWEY